MAHPGAVRHDSIPPLEGRADAAPGFYEFFAGGGMARAGLGPGWRCLFANDIDPTKAEAYRANFDAAALRVSDIAQVARGELPGRADLMWGSFPCQDLSLAGSGAGLAGARSGSVYAFWRLVEGLVAEGRAPRVVALENVCGTLSSRGGHDFAALCTAFAGAGYRFGALVIDAALFTPQSRPRLFLVGLHDSVDLKPGLSTAAPGDAFHTPRLRLAAQALPPEIGARWTWWSLPAPPPRRTAFSEMIDDAPVPAAWATAAQTARLLALMSPLHLAKLEAARRSGRRCVGTVYRRTRPRLDGGRVQRAEVRFDSVAGCLRTPAGGSSRQLLLVVEGERVRSRLLSPREAARLMGLPDSYRLPPRATAAYHLTGDGVVVPVVAHLARHLFEPLLGVAPTVGRQAA